MTLPDYVSNKFTHVAIIGALTSPFIEVSWIQIVVWVLTCISAVVSILVNLRRLFNKKRVTKNEKTTTR